jgi:hypothetical protein
VSNQDAVARCVGGGDRVACRAVEIRPVEALRHRHDGKKEEEDGEENRGTPRHDSMITRSALRTAGKIASPRATLLGMHRIFVTGATGFVGHAVVRALLAHGFLVRCLVRPGSESLLKGFESIDRVPGDVLEPDGLPPSVEGSAAIIHLVGIIREHRATGVTFDRLHTQATANMLGVAREAGVKRYIQMSAVGTRSGAVSRYHRTKWQAEGGSSERARLDHHPPLPHLRSQR